MPRDQHSERRTLPSPAAEAPARPCGIVIPLPARTSRPTRPAPSAGEARGEVLLFLGVRYERLAS